MNFRQWHLHILASTAILATSLSFHAAAQTSGSKAHPVASLEKNTNIQHHEPQSTASDFSAILQEGTWLDPNTKTLLGEFLHIGAVEEFHNLFASEKFNALDSTAKRQVINAVSEFAREYHIEKSARMATSEAMTRVLQGEVLSGKVFSETNSSSVEQEMASSTQAPVNNFNTGTKNVQIPVEGPPSQAQPVTPVQSPYSVLTQTPASQPIVPLPTPSSSHPTAKTSPAPHFGGWRISSPVRPVGGGGGSPVTTTASGGGGGSPVTTTASGGGGGSVGGVPKSGGGGGSPVTTTASVGGGGSVGGVPKSGGGGPVGGGGSSGVSAVLPTVNSKALEEAIISNGVTDKPAQILKSVFDNTKVSWNPFSKGGENYRFSQPYDELAEPKNQALIAALTSDERKQLASAVDALKIKALADSKSPGFKHIQASSDKVFNVVDRLDRHEGLHGVIKDSLGKNIDHNAISGDVQTYLAQYKQDKLAEWKKASWTKIGTGNDANFWHWQEAYEGIAKDPSFAKLSHEMQVAVSGELSAIAHREQANLKGDAPAAIMATDALHNAVESNVHEGVIAKTAVDHALPDPAATPHATVTHDVAELPSIADSKGITISQDKNKNKSLIDEMNALLDKKVKFNYIAYTTNDKTTSQPIINDPRYNDYYKYRAMQIFEQAKTDPVGAEAALHALKQQRESTAKGLGNKLWTPWKTVNDFSEIEGYEKAVEKQIDNSFKDPAHAQKILDTHALHEPVIQKSLAGVNAAHGAVAVQHTALGTAIGQAKEQVTKNSVVGDAAKNKAAQNAMTNLAAQHAEFVKLHNDANAHTAETQAQKAAVIAQMRLHADAVKDHLAREQHDILLAHIAQLEAAQADHAAIAQAHLAAFSGALIHNRGQAEHHLIGGNRPPVTHTL